MFERFDPEQPVQFLRYRSLDELAALARADARVDLAHEIIGQDNVNTARPRRSGTRIRGRFAGGRVWRTRE